MNINNQQNKVLGLLFAIFLFLTLWGMNQYPYWSDEADTAILAKNLVKQGKLTTWDGQNLAAFGFFAPLSHDLTSDGLPPLQYFIAALGNILLGDSVFAGRFFFWFLGIFSFPLICLWYRQFFKKERLWPLALILTFNISYLLYIPQARYYGPILTLYYFGLFLFAKFKDYSKSKNLFWYEFIFMGNFLFLVALHYLYAASFIMVILGHLLLREYRSKIYQKLLMKFFSLGLIGPIIIALYGRTWLGKMVDESWEGFFSSYFSILKLTLTYLTKNEWVPWGVIIFLLFSVKGIEKNKVLKKLGRELGRVAFFIGIILVTTWVLIASHYDLPNLRYVIVIIPLFSVMAALIFDFIWSRNKRVLACTMVLMLILTNYLHFNFYRPLQSRLWSYLQEKWNPRLVATTAIGEYIQKKIPKDKCIAFMPFYTVFSQIYYQDNHQYCALVSLRAKFVTTQNRKILPNRLFYELVAPDYFIIGNRPLDKIQEFLNYQFGYDRYQKVDSLPVYWDDATRPEISRHLFYPTEVASQSQLGLHIFKKIERGYTSKPKMSAKKAQLWFE